MVLSFLKRRRWPYVDGNRVAPMYFIKKRSWLSRKESRVALSQIYGKENGSFRIGVERVALDVRKRRDWPSPLYRPESGSFTPKEKKVALCRREERVAFIYTTKKMN